MKTAFEDAVAAALNKWAAGTTLLVSVSGGADSTAMFVALAAIRERAEKSAAFQLHCIHIEHGIRPAAESRGDAEFVRSLCRAFHVPCRVVSVKPGKIAACAKVRGIGIEAAARLYRRKAWFREVRRLETPAVPVTGPVRILVAHTADDMLETALMRILQGVGPSGLAAMPVRRGRIVRPLLSLSRADVLAYLTEKNIAWREDSTNKDTQFFRNRLRHRLIPLLNEDFPQWRRTIAALAETQSLTASCIRDEAARRITWQSLMPRTLHTNAETFFAQPVIIREEALFQGIDTLLADQRGPALSGSVKRANIRHFAQGAVTALDLGWLDLRHEAGNIVLAAKKNGARSGGIAEYGFSLLIKAPGSYNLKGIALSVYNVSECPANESGGDGVFFAALPLLVRPYFKDDTIINERKIIPPRDEFPEYTALDSWGPAAFIGGTRVMRRRNHSDTQRAVHMVTVGV